MTAAILCREMHWTWHELQEQPLWFVKQLVAYVNAEANHRQNQEKK